MSKETEELILDELRKLSKIITLVYGDVIERELSKVCTSNERKKIWVLMDGKRMSKNIAKEIGIAEWSVNRFLKIATNAGLAENPRGKPPYRVIDYVPPSWIELIELPEEKVEKEEEQT